MTRLTNDMVKDISTSLENVNDMLVRCAGMTTKEMACDAIAIDPNSIDLEEFQVGVIPITSGLGIISKFSESVSDIVKAIGMESFVTETTDVTGFAEALTRGADIIFMADDYEYIAFNVASKKYSNNSFGTASGYVAALNGAAKGLIGKTVLIAGAGRVGSRAANLLTARGAKVIVTDVDKEKSRALADNFSNVMIMDDIAEAISSNKYILNASPAHIPSEYIIEGAIISTPGIPHTFDEAAYRKATIIHDPLAIGTAVMAVQAASFSNQDKKKCRR
ncbi:MAG: 3-methylornithyl-N6-L-lysine dehydrogenase PylD [Candidatus Methanomethylophilaceae archaeon]|nr:3-methylornithyl-N6-L-lysine dehydrogenase PylD [Candidatus Methanomethylophilaceae archaeon]MDD3379226.1 3-methylornithyl-N6-L-lysine dehydrogenase PylD [Candidatus Methanomethylophilaceae archaeon]MDY0224504.1 3-methylornithyl-N6-L-lysine dehydrogenase PylD [Candidatus Methanomethylophilaceae archaeon]